MPANANLILEHSSAVPYYTDMRRVMLALGISAKKFDWYISDIETNVGELFPIEDRWLEGESLQRILDEHEIQFIWAVFSAVPRGYRRDVKVAPFADGNRNYWNDADVKPQLPGALFEIAAWDSSATLFVGLPEALSDSLLVGLPATRPLVEAQRRT